MNTRFVLALAIVVAVGAPSDRRATAAIVRVHLQSNGVLPPAEALPVRYQPLDEPELDQLARHENLHELVAGIPGQFDQIRRVQDWVNAQWADGTPDPYPPWNALMVLNWIRSGETGGYCAQYAQVFLQSLAALGYTARYVEIGSRENPYAHYVTEVWSNDFDKWVVMDADYNGHFERRGVPLSALEIHDALISSALTDVVPVFAEARAGHASTTSWPMHTAELYYYVRYHLGANQLTKPRDPPFDRFGDMIEFDDPRVPAWEVSPVTSDIHKERLTQRRFTDRAVADGRLNQVRVAVRWAEGNVVALDLRDDVVQRDSYEYRLNSTGAAPAPWQSTRQRALTLRLPDRGGVLEIRGVNIRGVAGPISVIAIDPVLSIREVE